MVDKIFIHGLEIHCIIGTLPRERKKKQKVVIHLEFSAPVRKAARRDALRDALNYQEIARQTMAFVSQSRFYLIETLAERLAETLFQKFKLRKIILRISKPNALPNAENAGVEIRRTLKGN